MPCVVLCLVLILPLVGLCFVSLSHCDMGRSVFCVSLSLCSGLWVDLCSVSLSYYDAGWSVFCVCLYCAVGWSVFCVSFFIAPMVGLSLSHCAADWSVFCLFLIVPLVGLCSISLSHCVVGL